METIKMEQDNKKLSLKEEQELEFRILLHFDSFCKSNSINYSLYAGTMLGAVRHKGFIPWDDDIDVLMTRENYNKFLSLYKSGNSYSLINYSKSKRCTSILFSKIFDNNTVAEEPNVKMIPGEGVWLDIFPIDYISNNKLKRFFTNLHFFLVDKLIYARSAKKPTLPYQLLKTFAFWKTNKSLLTSLDKYSCKAKKSNYLKNLTMIRGGEIKNDKKFPASYFSQYSMLEFCGHNFQCLTQYDQMLKIEYGDYMTLPPANERYSHSMNAYLKDRNEN
jgi:lipopolysaccharide cholinephosphotransferase